MLVGCGLTGTPEPPSYEPPTCELSRQAYRVARSDLPANVAAAQSIAFDLDGQGIDSNAVGTLFATIYQNFETAQEHWSGSIEEALDEPVAWLVLVDRCEEGDGDYVEVSLRRGVVTEQGVRLDAADGERTPSVGYASDQLLRTRDGEAQLPIGTLADVLGGHEPGWVLANGLQSELTIVDDETLMGRVGMGLGAGALSGATPPLLDFLNDRLRAGTSGMAEYYDADRSGEISPSEFRENPITQSMQEPDVDLMTSLDGREVYWPGQDGEADRLSYGVTVVARRVELAR